MSSLTTLLWRTTAVLGLSLLIAGAVPAISAQNQAETIVISEGANPAVTSPPAKPAAGTQAASPEDEFEVTEQVTDTDLIREMILVAAGERLSFRQEDIAMRGHAIEFRINAEDPDRNFQPSPGTISAFVPPAGPGVRWDSHVYQGYTVPPHYDSMVGKLIVHRNTRAQAIAAARRAIAEMTLDGIATTAPFHRELLQHAEFAEGGIDTGFVERVFQLD